MYCPLWFNSISSGVKKLKCSYNQCFTSFVMYTHALYIESEMFVTHGILSFYELLGKCTYNFSRCISSSRNSKIKACLTSVVFIFSPIRRCWQSVLILVNIIYSYAFRTLHYCRCLSNIFK